jgi:pilus assembly protein CpaF
LIVQIARFSEDGSRKIVAISEVRGLHENEYVLQDLFVSRRTGLTRSGAVITELESVGEQPTFAREAFEHGLERMVHYSAPLWDLKPA